MSPAQSSDSSATPGGIVAVLDDEAPIRKAVERLLRSAGFTVHEYASGAEFFAALPGRTPQCLVLDIGLEGMSGFDVQARLTRDHIALPIIFITALDHPGDEERAARAGAAAFLRKPFGPDELLDAIGQAIGASRGPAAN